MTKKNKAVPDRLVDAPCAHVRVDDGGPHLSSARTNTAISVIIKQHLLPI